MHSKNKFIKYTVVFLDGILLGVVSVGIPGFSASTIAVIIGIYFLMVDAMANIFKDPKSSIAFLAAQYLGYGVGSAVAALGVDALFTSFPLATVIVVIGLIAGSLPDQIIEMKGGIKKPSCYIVFILLGAAILLYNFLATEGDTVVFPDQPGIGFLIRMGIIGFFTSATFIVPGVDFALVFMSLGLYYPFSNMLANIVRFNSENYLHNLAVTGEILGVYLIGYFVGVFLLSKLIKYLIKKYNDQTKWASAAFVVVAPVIIIKNCVYDNASFFYSTPQLIIGIILGCFVGFLMFHLGYMRRKKEKLQTDNMLAKVNENIESIIENKDDAPAMTNEQIEKEKHIPD